MICVCLNHTPDIRGFESSPKMETSSNTPGWARKVESAWCTMVSFSSWPNDGSTLPQSTDKTIWSGQYFSLVVKSHMAGRICPTILCVQF